MQLLLLATLGGAIGSGARYLVNAGAARAFGPAFPWSTLIVNVVGCFTMGVLFQLIMTRYGGSAQLRNFFATGILGGFTTFSAFSLDFAMLIERQQTTAAVVYLVASVGLSLIGVFAGLGLARAVLV